MPNLNLGFAHGYSKLRESASSQSRSQAAVILAANCASVSLGCVFLVLVLG